MLEPKLPEQIYKSHLEARERARVVSSEAEERAQGSGKRYLARAWGKRACLEAPSDPFKMGP